MPMLPASFGTINVFLIDSRARARAHNPVASETAMAPTGDCPGRGLCTHPDVGHSATLRNYRSWPISRPKTRQCVMLLDGVGVYLPRRRLSGDCFSSAARLWQVSRAEEQPRAGAGTSFPSPGGRQLRFSGRRAASELLEATARRQHKDFQTMRTQAQEREIFLLHLSIEPNGLALIADLVAHDSWPHSTLLSRAYSCRSYSRLLNRSCQLNLWAPSHREPAPHPRRRWRWYQHAARRNRRRDRAARRSRCRD
jgi:hypothetical protein